MLHPPSDDLPSEKDETWNRGASIAHEILAHSSISMPPPLQSTASLPPLASSSRPHSAARSVSRSYAHPSMTLPPPAAHPHPHAHLSPSTKLRITVTVHALYLLALQVWPTDKGAAEGYWKDIISVGGTGVGTKEGEEVVERARRRVEGIHHKEGPGEAWHLAKQKGRGRKAKRGVTTGTVGMDALEGEARDALCEIWQEKREKEELWQAQAHASVSPPAVKVDRKGKGRARSSEEEQPSTSGSFAASSAITIRANGEHDHSRGPSSLSTSTISNSRTPRPSKFHFAQDPPDSYPSPPDTPGHSPPAEMPHEGHGIVASSSSFTNTIATEEPESYFPILPSTSPETSISTSRSLGSQAQLASTPLAPPRRIGSRASMASAHPLSPSSRLLSRVRSSASVSTLPPDFGSTRPAWSRQSSKAVGGVSLASSGGERVGRARSSTTCEGTPLLSAAESSSGWRSGWKSRLSSLKESSSRLIEGLKSNSSDGGPPSAAEVLRRMLEKDDESAGPGMEWAVLEEEGLETEHEGEHPEELNEEEDDQDRLDQQQFSDANLLAPPQPPFASGSNSGSRSPTSSGQHTPTLHLSPKSSKPRLQRLKSSISTRSFIDVTSAEPRYSSALTNPPTPERGSRSSSLVAAHQRRSFSSPDLPGAPRDMDPLLVELERKSRVGVKTVCATCGKKGLNYPKARGGQTYCSRDCRVKGLKVQETMEGRERNAMAAAARVSVAAQG